MSSLRFFTAAIAFTALLASSACFAEEPAALAQSYRSDIKALGFELFERGYSEFEAAKDRKGPGTQFIPNEITAYPDDESKPSKIMFLIRYRHGGDIKTDAEAQTICKGMINWVRFHLGVEEDGRFITNASKYASSTLYVYIPPKDELRDPKAYASALDASTIILSQVVNMHWKDNPAGNASCHEPLIPEVGQKAINGDIPH